MKIRSISAALAAILLVSACARPPDEAQIRAQIERQERTAEAGKIGAFMAAISEDFVGQRGQFDASGLREMLRVQLLAHTRISVLISGLEITVNQDIASAQFNALLTGGAGWLPASGAFYKVSTDWQKRDGEWQVIAAQWEGSNQLQP